MSTIQVTALKKNKSKATFQKPEGVQHLERIGLFPNAKLVATVKKVGRQFLQVQPIIDKWNPLVNKQRLLPVNIETAKLKPTKKFEKGDTLTIRGTWTYNVKKRITEINPAESLLHATEYALKELASKHSS